MAPTRADAAAHGTATAEPDRSTSTSCARVELARVCSVASCRPGSPIPTSRPTSTSGPAGVERSRASASWHWSPVSWHVISPPTKTTTSASCAAATAAAMPDVSSVSMSQPRSNATSSSNAADARAAARRPCSGLISVHSGNSGPPALSLQPA